VFESRTKKKKSLTGPGKPQICSHLIYAQTLTGVCQAVISSNNKNSVEFGANMEKATQMNCR